MQRCFIVSIVSAVAFTAIGTTPQLEIGFGKDDKSVYILYGSFENDKVLNKNLSIIKHLSDANIPYRMASSSYIHRKWRKM